MSLHMTYKKMLATTVPSVFIITALFALWIGSIGPVVADTPDVQTNVVAEQGGVSNITQGDLIIKEEKILNVFTKKEKRNLRQKIEEDVILDILSQKERTAKLEAYFKQWDLPASEYAEEFVKAADKYEIEDWALVPSLALLESTGCKYTFKLNNCFGWGQTSFSSIEEAIDTVTKNLAGKNPNTEKYYKDKTVEEILIAYNPPETKGIMPGYHKKAIRVMDEIKNMSLSADGVMVLALNL